VNRISVSDTRILDSSKPLSERGKTNDEDAILTLVHTEVVVCVCVCVVEVYEVLLMEV
jgi:hypothetical protein